MPESVIEKVVDRPWGFIRMDSRHDRFVPISALPTRIEALREGQQVSPAAGVGHEGPRENVGAI
jgi:cold shock CspA family protein